MLPFILRGVSLLGIDSVRTPPVLRQQAWNRLAEHLDPARLDTITHVVPLQDARTAAASLLQGRGTGRTIVQVAP